MPIYDAKVLAQARPSGTSAVSLYSPTELTELDSIIVVNTTGTAATFTLYLDNDGTTYDADSMVYPTTTLAATNGFFEWVFADGEGVTMNNSSGNFAIKQGTGSALNYTLFGKEKVAI